jgi:hypothetical protein
MASAGNWSVVGKTKKSKGQNQNLTKSQRKQFIDNMPRIAPLGKLIFFILRNMKKKWVGYNHS